MAHDPYMNAEYEASQRAELHHSIGLGIQYVSLVLNDCDAHLI